MGSTIPQLARAVLEEYFLIPGTQYLIIDNQNERCDIILHGKNSS